MDVKLNAWNYRIIAIYAPHAGYTVHEFNICFDDLRKCVLEGQRNGRKCVIGGDFNTDLERMERGSFARVLVRNAFGE